MKQKYRVNFEAGDTVEIQPYLKFNKKYNKYRLLKPMYRMKGKTFILNDPCYESVMLEGYYFNVNMLKLVKKGETNNVK